MKTSLPTTDSITNSNNKAYHSDFLLSDEDILKLGIQKHDVESYRRKHYQDSFGLDTWYDKLTKYTFPTKTIPLEYEEALLILNYNKESLENSKEAKAFEKKLDDVLQNEYSFIKLNTRSPKDVAHSSHEKKKYQDIILSELKYIQDRKNHDQILHAFVRGQMKSLKIQTGKEAIELLTNSYRIREDLMKNINFGKEHFKSKLEIRKWVSVVPEHPECEFRCFVHQSNMNAASQYFCELYSDYISSNKEKIGKMILKFFNEVLKEPLRSHDNYVIDLFMDRTDGDKFYVIELNPFHIGAGACLFSWKLDRDLFLNGPFEIRVQTNHFKGDYQSILSIGWEKFLQKHL